MKPSHRVFVQAAAILLTSYAATACSLGEVIEPGTGIPPLDSASAATIEITVPSERMSDLLEADTITVAAVVRDYRGNLVTSGVVRWTAAGGVSVSASTNRTANVRVRSGANLISASLPQPYGHFEPSTAKALDAAPRSPTAFFWSPETGVVLIAPPPGARSFSPRDINDAGQVVGYADFGGAYRMALWSPGEGYRQVDLTAQVTENVHPEAINGAGAVVGWTYNNNADEVRPFMWTPSSGILRPTLNIQGGGALATSINSSGTVVGDLNQSGFRWSTNGDVTLVPFMVGYGCGGAVDINDEGDILAWEGNDVQGWGCTPFRYYVLDRNGVRAEVDECADVGACYMDAMNDRREIAGTRSDTFRWSPSTGLTLMGKQGSFARDINDSGDIGGGLGGERGSPFVWMASGEIITFPVPKGARTGSVEAINNKRQAVGTFY